MAIFSSYADTYYTTYELSFPNEVPSSVFVIGAECADNSCTEAVNTNTKLYTEDAITCWTNFVSSGNEVLFSVCMDAAEISGNIVPVSGNNQKFVTSVELPTSYGHLNYFSANGDSYLVKYERVSNYNCGYEYCFDPQIFDVDFQKKTSDSIAEIGQLNIKNIDDPNKPVQIEVPVSIEETVCSAYRFTNADWYRPTIPSGYSDFSANTLVNLTISNANTNVIYREEAITIPIEADTCAGLAAFSWTPNSSLEDEDIKFRVDSEVVDNQVTSSLKDWTEVIETIYPSNLNGACWTRSYDFMLSNTPSNNLNTSVAQIMIGESLYAVFDAGAFRDESLTPMNFEARVYFDNSLISTDLLNSGTDIDTYYVDLTSQITGLSAGNHEVKLVTTPVGIGCSVLESVTQIQQLTLLTPPTYNVYFFVKDAASNDLVNANVNLELTNDDDYYVTPPTYNITQLTNSLGASTFIGVYRGDYTYTISKDGYTTVINDVFVGSDTTIYITLPEGNTAPRIDLPTQFSEYYANDIVFDMRDYVDDYNDGFSDLSFTINTTGAISVSYSSPYVTISAVAPTTGRINISVFDPSGANNSDVANVVFTSNQPSVINEFRADPDNGAEPFNTTFIINATDAENDSMICTIDFGDGTNTSSSCSSLSEINHVYSAVGTYNAVLTVNDGTNEVTETEQVFVFARIDNNGTPHIDYFVLESTNGYVIPTDITLRWSVSHTMGADVTCNLRLNGANIPVDCDDGSYFINDFNTNGTSTFNLIAIDEYGTQVLRILERTFYEGGVSLTADDVSLIMDDVIAPGEFKFSFTVTDEMLSRRDINVIPIIVCQDVENKLKTSLTGILDNSFVSKVEADNSIEYELTTTTRDFKLKVPTDETCTFKVNLIDEYGTDLTLEKNVVFSYPQEARAIQSIRGNSLDIMNFMSSALSGDMKSGYNTIEFRVVNQQSYEKELSVTFISADLGIENSFEETLGAYGEKELQIPVFISKNVKPGLYPIRISVYDGEDKQTRYTYLKIE